MFIKLKCSKGIVHLFISVTDLMLLGIFALSQSLSEITEPSRFTTFDTDNPCLSLRGSNGV
jgi:hypothetical protein